MPIPTSISRLDLFSLSVQLVKELLLHHPRDGVSKSSEPAVCCLSSATGQFGTCHRNRVMAATAIDADGSAILYL